MQRRRRTLTVGCRVSLLNFSLQVNILEKRKSIPLDQNEGIYVRNLKSGKVSSIVGRSYMLKPDEELYVKRLPPTVESLLEKQVRFQ